VRPSHAEDTIAGAEIAFSRRCELDLVARGARGLRLEHLPNEVCDVAALFVANLKIILRDFTVNILRGLLQPLTPDPNNPESTPDGGVRFETFFKLWGSKALLGQPSGSLDEVHRRTTLPTRTHNSNRWDIRRYGLVIDD
jgi:hypothetical protein